MHAPSSAIVLGLSVVLVAGGSRGQSVTVALLKPWNGGATAFSLPPSAWSPFGGASISFVNMGNGPITLSALSQLDPDVIFLSDPAGGIFTISPAEISAIQLFLSTAGKRLIGTYAAFQWNLANNLGLLPLFGLASFPSMGFTGISTPALAILDPSHFLVSGAPTSFGSGTYPSVQVPPDSRWDPGDYLGSLVASDSANLAIVHYWNSGVHDAVYVSYMPEYTPTSDDLRLLYNAITGNLGQNALSVSPLGIPAIGTQLQLQVYAPTFPNRQFLVALALGTTLGIPLSDGRRLPLDPDWLFALSLTSGNGFFSSSTGVLDAFGVGTPLPLLTIPATPQLVGTTIYAAFATDGGPPPTGIGGISLPLAITFQ